MPQQRSLIITLKTAAVEPVLGKIAFVRTIGESAINQITDEALQQLRNRHAVSGGFLQNAVAISIGQFQNECPLFDGFDFFFPIFVQHGKPLFLSFAAFSKQGIEGGAAPSQALK